jgi:hypothetical protein
MSDAPKELQQTSCESATNVTDHTIKTFTENDYPPQVGVEVRDPTSPQLFLCLVSLRSTPTYPVNIQVNSFSEIS